MFLRNRSPTKALQGVTPVEAWTGKKPDVSNLHIFGCTAYAHVPKDERRKLESKTRRCVFLGYGTTTKGYRLYDLNRAKVFLSRDVIFDEAGSEILEESEKSSMKNTSTEPKCIQLESETEKEESENESDNVGNSTDATTASLPRRSERNRKNPDWFGNPVAYVAENQQTCPSTVNEALSSSEGVKWGSAMEKEMKSLHYNKVWDLVELPRGKSVLGSKWVFKRKPGPDGQVEQYKARLVAQGCAQRPGSDYDETFSPVVRFESLRTMI